MPKKRPYRLVRSKKIYEGHVIRVFQDLFVPDFARDKVFKRDVVEHSGAVVVVPFVDKNHVLLVRQFRYAVKEHLWEIPAGTLEKGESWLGCARRELEEETGFRARRWKYLSRFYAAPGYSSEVMALYKAWDLRLSETHMDEDEFIETKEFSFEKAMELVRRGAIRDAKSLVGILWVAHLG